MSTHLHWAVIALKAAASLASLATGVWAGRGVSRELYRELYNRRRHPSNEAAVVGLAFAVATAALLVGAVWL